MFYRCFIIVGLLLGTVVTFAQTKTGMMRNHPFYVGATLGYGATTWDGLVPSPENVSEAINISTPTSVEEGGVVAGAFVGYEFSPFFAVEASYMRYPDADVHFDPMSLFAFENDGQLQLKTHAEVVAVMGKIMLIIPETTIRAYSSFGIADVHRFDDLVDRWRFNPTFGIGLNHNVAQHIMVELGGNYTAGYGESELNPVEDYMPFLYSFFIRFAYRI